MEAPQSCDFSSGNSDFANYRIKWTADVESFFQRKLKKTQSRKLLGEESEEEICYDPEKREPIRKPTPSNVCSPINSPTTH